MFEHSIRVPRHYKIAANIFKKVSTEGGSVKTLLYDNKLRHFRTNVLFALITETVKHAADIDKIFEACEILTNESRLDPWLAKVLTAEILFGKKSLPGVSKPEQTILAYKEKFEKYANEHEAELKTEVVHRPRYVRINTNLLTTSDAIRSFQDEGYRFIRCTSGSYNDYLEQIKGLTEYDFIQDYHVKTVFVFPHGTKLHEHELYLENQIILQDKATALAVHLLAPSSGSVVLDMCAAPGMKTTQVAAYMRNMGKVIAVERNEKRFQTLTEFVTKTGCKCVELLHKDALEIKRGDYDDVEYILLDPSCSGSGMEFTVHNYIEESRLAKLTSLQEKFLKHAMNAFPKAKRIVYSTCSLFPEENERVITNVVRNSRAKWRVQDVKEMLKGQWNNFGSGMYGSIGTRCLYAKPDSDLTTGFFLAVLDRDPIDLEKNINGNNPIVSNELNSDKNTNKDFILEQNPKKNNEFPISNLSQTEDAGDTSSKKKKKKKKENTEANFLNKNLDNNTGVTETKDPSLENIPQSNVLTNESGLEVSKKKKKNKKREHSVEPDPSKAYNHDIVIGEEITTKKSKKKKRKYEDQIENQASNAYIIEETADNDQQRCKNKRVAEDDSVTERKNNKKHKNKNSVENGFSDAVINEEVIVQDMDKARKKDKRELKGEHVNLQETTKKRKCEHDIDNQFNDERINEEAIVNDDHKSKKKKKKKDKNYEQGEKNSENIEENHIDPPGLSNLEDCKTNVLPDTKKKKKNRDKNTNK